MLQIIIDRIGGRRGRARQGHLVRGEAFEVLKLYETCQMIPMSVKAHILILIP
jgi:hypothetical protein